MARIAVALIDPIGAAVAWAGTGRAFHFQRHQTLGGKADHFAQQIGIGALFQKRAKVHRLCLTNCNGRPQPCRNHAEHFLIP